MIDDRMEEGMCEADAVCAVGSPEEIAAQIKEDGTLFNQQEKKTKRSKKSLWITLLAVGSPIWVSFGAVAFAVLLTVFVSLWAVIISLWASFGALAVSALGGIVGGVGLAIGGIVTTGLVMVAAGMVCAGLSIFLFCGCRAATKGFLLLTKSTVLLIKRYLVKEKTV